MSTIKVSTTLDAASVAEARARVGESGFSRFLNEALRSVPDIDLDFPRDIREELILRIYEVYGREHAGLVCTFPTYRLRSAVREIGKALDLPMAEIEKLSMNTYMEPVRAAIPATGRVKPSSRASP